MLAVQVQYLNYAESKRHNLVTEQQGEETLRQGREGLRISDFNSITQRRSQEEQARHNVASENISMASLRESQRHNVASETISIASLNETERHNIAMEQENVRHNTEQEAIGRTQAQASMISARASGLSAQASMTSAQASLKNAQLNETKWNTSEYYIQQTERNKNIAQTAYYESQTTTGMMGAVGRLIGGAGSLIGTFLK